MHRGFVLGVLVLGLTAACKGDKEEAVPVQQAGLNDSTAATSGAPAAPAANPAPAPARPAPSRTAAEIAASAAATELANTRVLRTIQVGAFPSSATAEWWVNELKRQGIPAYSVHTMVNGAEVTRLRIGVATSTAEARALADKVHARYQWPVWITTVDDRSLVSGEMLTATRAYALGNTSG